MSDLLLTSVEYGGYISIVKFAVFLLSFFSWLLLIKWVNSDSEQVHIQSSPWLTILWSAGAAALIFWMLIPVFIIGLLIYLIAVSVAALAYIKYRDNSVSEAERVLSIAYFSTIFSSDRQEKTETPGDFLFITANNNQVPTPQPRTPEFSGYKAALDLFNDAIRRRASSILLSPTHAEYNIIYTVDGAAIKRPPIQKQQAQMLIQFVKNLAALDTEEKRKPQQGNFKILRQGETAKWHAATAGSTAGEEARIKPLTELEIAKLDELGLADEQLNLLTKVTQTAEGLVLITGTPKSGVTTTFYSMLRKHDAFLNTIDTLERRPSANLPNIRQKVFALTDTGTSSYPKMLQSIIETNPDIIGIADCRDSETARIALQAAGNGKLVYVTLQADNVLKALNKWLELVADKDLALNCLMAITSQKLLRKLCDKCKEGYTPNKEVLRKFNLPSEKVKVLYRPGKVIYKKRGKSVDCDNCQATGFVGRTAVFEVAAINRQLKENLKQSTTPQEIAKHLRNTKMRYLQEQTLRKIIAGTTAINEMIRVFSTSKRKRVKKPRA